MLTGPVMPTAARPRPLLFTFLDATLVGRHAEHPESLLERLDRVLHDRVPPVERSGAGLCVYATHHEVCSKTKQGRRPLDVGVVARRVEQQLIDAGTNATKYADGTTRRKYGRFKGYS